MKVINRRNNPLNRDKLRIKKLYSQFEEEVLETLFRSDSTESATNRWNKFNILLRKNLNETDLGPEEFLQAIRKGSNRYLYESDSEYYDAVQNKLDDDEQDIEDNVDVLRNIVKSKQNKSVMFKDGKKAKVDLFTASALIQFIDKVNPDNKAKLTKMINGSLKSFLQAQNAVMKMVSMR